MLVSGPIHHKLHNKSHRTHLCDIQAGRLVPPLDALNSSDVKLLMHRWGARQGSAETNRVAGLVV